MNNVVVNSMAKSILHILNVKLQNLPPIIFSRETNQYRIFYEQKTYAIHKLLIKVQKNLDIQKDNVDINVNVYNRLTIKSNTNLTQLMIRPEENLFKTIAMRITKTKYSNLPLKYINFVQLYEKKTWVGAEVKFIPEIQECGLVIKDAITCYKTINTQKANTHWMKTVTIVKPSQEQIKIGKLIIITSNYNAYEKDLYV